VQARRRPTINTPDNQSDTLIVGRTPRRHGRQSRDKDTLPTINMRRRAPSNSTGVAVTRPADAGQRLRLSVPAAPPIYPHRCR
jgi:hypothetical protein